MLEFSLNSLVILVVCVMFFTVQDNVDYSMKLQQQCRLMNT